MMNGLMQDIRYAVRQLRVSAGFSVIVVFTLALTIAMSTAVFSSIYAVLIRPLPFDHPERIVSLETWSPQGYTQPAAYPEYLDWRRESHVFAVLSVFNSYGSANFEGPSGPIALAKVEGSDNFFEVFGVAALLGRTFTKGEDQPGKNDVAVLSYEVWQQQFAAQPSAIGRIIRLDGLSYTVVGVMPAGFRYPINIRNAIYTPLHMPKELAESRTSHWLPVIARLREGVRSGQAQADMNRVFDDLGQVFPGSKGRRVKILSIATNIVGKTEAPLIILIFAVLALLAIGCVNLAGLLLARGVKREREFALRAAVGAARFRIIRQMLTEMSILAFFGALGGIMLAYVLLESIRTLLIAALARGAEVHLDVAALLVALILAVLTTVVAGVGGTLRLSLIPPNLALKSGGTTGPSRAQHRLRSAFIVVQMALALVLLITSGVLLRVLAGLRGTDLGFSPDHLLSSEIDLSAASYEGRDAFANFYRPLLENLQSLPGVKAAGLIQVLPIQNWGWNSDIHVVGHPPDPPNQERLAETRFVSPSYFATMGISLIRGRLLDDSIDTRTSQSVVVVNEAFVKKFFAPNEDPIEKYVEGWIGKIPIVGIVHSIRQNVYEEPLAEMDCSIAQIPAKDLMQAVSTMSLIVRTTGEPQSVLGDLRRVYHNLDPGLPLREPLTMRQVVADVLVLERLENWLFGTFAGLAVLLAIIGLYGAISHEVELSTREIGVRIALGATRGTVFASIYGRVALMLSGGVILGLLLTATVTKLISAMVPLQTPKNLGVIFGLAMGLFAVGVLAVLSPAWRAARVDPMVTLRYE
jgi:putative ABC transport system permease protein